MPLQSRSPLALTFMLALLAACSANYRDVSNEQPYSKYADRLCMVNQELQAQGVALNYERARGTEYVVVGTPLAVRSYTTFVHTIHAGAEFKVVGIRRCTNCPFDETVEFRVIFDPEPTEFKGKPVYLKRFDALEQVAKCG